MIPQNLGIFEKYRTDLEESLQTLGTFERSKVSHFTILDHYSDPKFPFKGLAKKIYFCVANANTITLAHRVSSADKEFYNQIQNEVDFYKKNYEVDGISLPYRTTRVGKYVYCIHRLWNYGDGLNLIQKKLHVKIPQWNRLWIGYSLALTVAKLHNRGFVLRDLKLNNTLIRQKTNGTFTAAITDFGMAFHLQSASKWEKKMFCGTPSTLAPEMWQKKGANFPVDVWAYGHIIYGLEAGIQLMKDYKRFAKTLQLPPCTFDKPFLYEQIVRDCLEVNPDLRPTMVAVARRTHTLFLEAFPTAPVIEKMKKEDDELLWLEICELLEKMHEEERELICLEVTEQIPENIDLICSYLDI